MLDGFTVVSCIIIAIAFFMAWIYVARLDKHNFLRHKRWIDQFPSIISTLGVLGTFAGITKGLITFDTTNLDVSIPLLLDGLKTAFFTSLTGMICSLFLSKIVANKFENEETESDVVKAAKLIIDTLNANQRALPGIMNNSNQNLVKTLSENETIKVIHEEVEQLKDDVEELKGHTEELKQFVLGLNAVLNAIRDNTGSTKENIPRLTSVALTATASISTIDNNFADLKDAISKLQSTADSINDNMEEIVSLNERNNDEEDF